MLALASASLRYPEAFPALVVVALLATLSAKAASQPPAVRVAAQEQASACQGSAVDQPALLACCAVRLSHIPAIQGVERHIKA